MFVLLLHLPQMCTTKSFPSPSSFLVRFIMANSDGRTVVDIARFVYDPSPMHSH